MKKLGLSFDFKKRKFSVFIQTESSRGKLKYYGETYNILSKFGPELDARFKTVFVRGSNKFCDNNRDIIPSTFNLPGVLEEFGRFSEEMNYLVVVKVII